MPLPGTGAKAAGRGRTADSGRRGPSGGGGFGKNPLFPSWLLRTLLARASFAAEEVLLCLVPRGFTASSPAGRPLAAAVAVFRRAARRGSASRPARLAWLGVEYCQADRPAAVDSVSARRGARKHGFQREGREEAFSISGRCAVSSWAVEEFRALRLEEIDVRYARYRLSALEAEETMARSLRRYGQISPRGGLPAGRVAGVGGRLQAAGGGAGPEGVWDAVGAADRSGRAGREGGDVRAEPHGAALRRVGRGVAGASAGAGRRAVAGRSGSITGASQELGLSAAWR